MVKSHLFHEGTRSYWNVLRTHFWKVAIENFNYRRSYTTSTVLQTGRSNR